MGSVSGAELERGCLWIEGRVLVEVFGVIQVDPAQYDRLVLHADRERDQRTQGGSLLENQIDAVRWIKQSL